MLHRTLKLTIAAVIALAALGFQTDKSVIAKGTAVKILSNQTIEQEAYYIPNGRVLYQKPKLTGTKTSSTHFKKVTWYADRTAIVQKNIDGKVTKAVYLRVTNETGNKTFWTWRGNLKQITSPYFKVSDTVAAKRFKNVKLAYMGDSIPHGWNGYTNYLTTNYPTWMSKYMGINLQKHKPTNMAISNGKILGTTQRDMSQIVPKWNFKNYDILTIQYGTNDDGHGTESLKDVMTELQTNITTIKKQNPKLKIYGFLPISRFAKGTGLPAKNIKMAGGYTFKQLRDAERKLYKKNKIPVLDFQKLDPGLITRENRKVTLRDHVVHPAVKTNQQLGRIAATFIENHYK
ncbi:hypothetical protein LOSG293_130240 [Secundilactobacillus oryzae JCM 18671]|uniref:SGNH hydrolase-type esterase domain-containing protein n=1 Tax=Secundilactobacillus oryzae JCM 18671 TaxID=1291743 RepID=A0A081BIG7_9LACO|nr:SGNH/GDSL hydrolase family protein [Secundilactobacillus oryzae]GAK47835.1 hypothetical protein LOSG293_130240 [Secundilactobacillus oryzae JCM 18671]